MLDTDYPLFVMIATFVHLKLQKLLFCASWPCGIETDLLPNLPILSKLLSLHEVWHDHFLVFALGAARCHNSRRSASGYIFQVRVFTLGKVVADDCSAQRAGARTTS